MSLWDFPLPAMILLVDHDNVPYESRPLRSLIEAWTRSLSDEIAEAPLVTAHVRAYGGWFLEEWTSPARSSAADFYQRTCPAIIGSRPLCKVTFEFADNILLDSGVEPPRVTHTVARRPGAQVVRALGSLSPCAESGCQLAAVRRWVKKKRACLKPACPHLFADRFERQEQKQVDVHLAIDLVSLSRRLRAGMHVAIASDDWDFLPALALASQGIVEGSSISVIRFKPTPTYLDSTLRSRGIRVLTL